MGNNKIIYAGNLTVRYSMYDFIAAVREFPLLWDRTNPDFHIRDKRDQAWQDVCGKVCTHFSEVTKDAREKIVEMLIKRWKNTRDCYLRSLRLRDDTSNCIRRYIYEEELSFLASRQTKTTDKTLSKSNRKRAASSNTTSPRTLRSGLVAANSETSKKLTENPGQNDFDSEFDSICMDVDDIVNGTKSDPLIIKPGLKKETALKFSSTSTIPLKDHIIEVDTKSANETAVVEKKSCDRTGTEYSLNKNKFFIENVTEVDADQAFFDSIKPVMRNLSSDTKLDFQIEVLKLLKHFRNK